MCWERYLEQDATIVKATQPVAVQPHTDRTPPQDPEADSEVPNATDCVESTIAAGAA